MAKKRKTRQQKVITQLKRQLVKQAQPKTGQGKKKSVRQEAILTKANFSLPQKSNLKKNDNTVLWGDSSLIKKDLLKTISLALIILSFEIVLYLKLR